MMQSFSSLSTEARASYITSFTSFYNDSLPSIESNRGPVSAIKEAFSLLSAFPYTRAFIEEANLLGDYTMRIAPLRRFADRIYNELTASSQTTTTSKPLFHVGRPTKQEQETRRALAQKAAEAHAAANPSLFSDEEAKDAPAAPATVSGSLFGGSLLHLDQLKPFLPEALRAEVDNIRGLRASAAEAATKAKQMAEDGRPASEVEPYAQKAAQDTEAYERIYEAVDNALATTYVRLKEDSAYIADIKSKGGDPSAIRTSLRPYFDRQPDKEAFKAKVISWIKENDPVQAAARKAQEELLAQKAKLIKAISRKDKAPTPRRIAGMKQKYAALVALIGESEAAPYYAYITAAESALAEK